jgi:hypothetical protein
MTLAASHPDSAAPVAKAGIAWFGVAFAKAGITTWSDVAAVLAAVYSALLIAGWLWRAFVRWRAGRALEPETGPGDL